MKVFKTRNGLRALVIRDTNSPDNYSGAIINFTEKKIDQTQWDSDLNNIESKDWDLVEAEKEKEIY